MDKAANALLAYLGADSKSSSLPSLGRLCTADTQGIFLAASMPSQGVRIVHASALSRLEIGVPLALPVPGKWHILHEYTGRASGTQS
jgi:hypothetical protein